MPSIACPDDPIRPKDVHGPWWGRGYTSDTTRENPPSHVATCSCSPAAVLMAQHTPHRTCPRYRRGITFRDTYRRALLNRRHPLPSRCSRQPDESSETTPQARWESCPRVVAPWHGSRVSDACCARFWAAATFLILIPTFVATPMTVFKLRLRHSSL